MLVDDCQIEASAIIHRGGILLGEVTNCPNCEALFMKTKFRDVCDSCYKEEEKLFERVYQFIRKRDNRTASMVQVIEETGVEEELIIKFIRNGRLKLAQFPNLGYKCDRCDSTIREGTLCRSCIHELQSELKVFERDEQLKKELKERDHRATYHLNGQ